MQSRDGSDLFGLNFRMGFDSPLVYRMSQNTIIPIQTTEMLFLDDSEMTFLDGTFMAYLGG